MDNDIKDLLKKYIKNRCSRNELEQVKEILASGLYQEEWMDIMQEETEAELTDYSEVNTPSFNSSRVLGRISESTTVKGSKINTYRWYIGIAAAIFFTFSIGYFFMHTNVFSGKKVQFTTLSTRSGEHKLVTLTDGSRIILNNKSTIHFISTFSKNRREVYLNGEAFFDVIHDDSRPFIVHTGKVNVHVLGTSFDVKSYKTDRHVTVGVVTGKVGVTKHGKSGAYMLLPGDVLSSDADTFRKSKIDAAEITGWQNGTLVFHQEGFVEIVAELQRWYNISIIVHKNALLKKRITASFSRKSLPEVMEVLSNTAGFNYKIIKNEVHIN